MKYEDYLNRFCERVNPYSRFDETHYIKLPLRIRLRKWLLERKGFIVKIEIAWHHYTINPNETPIRFHGVGYARIQKYKPLMPNASVELKEGDIE